MIRIFIGKRFYRMLDELGPEYKKDIQEILAAVASDFGNPHKHGGLGLRKVYDRIYEARIRLQWRIIFIQDQDGLMAYDIMTHDELTAFLKKRR